MSHVTQDIESAEHALRKTLIRTDLPEVARTNLRAALTFLLTALKLLRGDKND
jgi:hypothetical protein